MLRVLANPKSRGYSTGFRPFWIEQKRTLTRDKVKLANQIRPPSLVVAIPVRTWFCALASSPTARQAVCLAIRQDERTSLLLLPR